MYVRASTDTDRMTCAFRKSSDLFALAALSNVTVKSVCYVIIYRSVVIIVLCLHFGNN